MQRPAAFDRIGRAVISGSKACPFAHFFRRTERILRLGADLGKNFHCGIQTYAGHTYSDSTYFYIESFMYKVSILQLWKLKIMHNRNYPNDHDKLKETVYAALDEIASLLIEVDVTIFR